MSQLTSSDQVMVLQVSSPIDKVNKSYMFQVKINKSQVKTKESQFKSRLISPKTKDNTFIVNIKMCKVKTKSPMLWSQDQEFLRQVKVMTNV